MDTRRSEIDRLFDAHAAGHLSRRQLMSRAAALGLILAGSGPLGRAVLARSAPRRGGTLKIAAPAATNIDPLKLNSAGGIAIVQQVAEYLVWAEPHVGLRPVLATEWAPTEGGRVWTFAIRRGVRFHDGRPLTAHDVAASFRRLVDPANGSPAAGAMPFLKPAGIEAPDEHLVRFTLDRPIGAFPYFTHTYNAVILPADHSGDFAAQPIGTGPFRMVSYRPQEGAILERNPDYWNPGRPWLDRVEIRTYGSVQPMILALKSGDVHAIQQLSWLDAQGILGDEGTILIEAESADHRQLCMRTDAKPFDDARVRRAIALCIDRPALVQGLLGGRATLGNDHPIAPIYPERVTLPQRTANLTEARRLLAEAGYARGIAVDLYTHQHLELPQYAAVLQQMLAPAGIRANLKVEPTNLYYEHWTEVPFGLTEWASRPVATQILSQSFRSTAEWNAAHWRNERFDRLLERLEAESDMAKRNTIGTEIAALMQEEVPAAITYFVRTLRAVRRGVEGLPGSMSNYLDLTETSLGA